MTSALNAAQKQAQIAGYLILNIVSGTVGGAMQIVVPLYALSLHAALSQVGLIRGVSGIGTLLLVIPVGFLVDLFGSKRLFLVGAVAGTIATYLLSYSKVPVDIALIMGIAGLFGSLKMNSLNASFFSNLQSMGIEKAGWFKGSMSIGLTFLGPVLGAYLIHALDYPHVFKLLALLTLVPIALVFIFHKEPTRTASSVPFKEAMSIQLADFKRLIGWRVLYLPLLTESLSTAFFATFSAFVIILAVQSLHLAVSRASLLLTIEGGVFIVTVFAASSLIRILSVLQLYAFSVAVVVGGLIYLSVAGTFAALAVSTVILGFGLGLLNLVVSSWIGRIEGEKGKIVGLFSAAVSVGASIGPMVGGLIGSRFGTRVIFLSFIPIFIGLVAAAKWLQFGDRLSPAQHESGEEIVYEAEKEIASIV